MSYKILDLSQEPQAPAKPVDFDTNIFSQYAYSLQYKQYTDDHTAWSKNSTLAGDYKTKKLAWNSRYLDVNGPPPNMPRPMPPFAILSDGSTSTDTIVCAEVPDPAIPPANPTNIAAPPSTSTPTPYELAIYQMLVAIKAKTDKLP